MPLRNLSITTCNKVREITDNINWLKSQSKKAVAIRAIVNSQSPNSVWAMQNAVMNSQSDEKLVLSSLKNKKDKAWNATRRIVASSIAKSSTPLTTQRIRDLQTFLSLLKAVYEQSIDILFHTKIKQRSNNIGPILTEKVINFYNNYKISRVVPHKNATVLVKNSNETKERVCLRILEKIIEATYHSVCNENPECSFKLRKFGELCPQNIGLRKMAQRAVCCCTIHVNVDYLRKAAIRYCQIIGQDSTTISCNEKLCDNILCEEPNINSYHRKCTDCKAKSLTGLKNLICSSKCYVENVDWHAQDHVINFKQFERIEYFHAGKSKKKLSLNNKCVTLKEFVQYFHEKIDTFAGHCFNRKHTNAMIY